MKRYLLLCGFSSLFLLFAAKTYAQVTNPGTVVQTDASNQTNNNINNSVNNGLNNVASGVKGLFKKKKKMTHADSVQMMQQQQLANPNALPASSNKSSWLCTRRQLPPSRLAIAPNGSLASYQNYDFVPGNNILFEDEFTDDQSGEFPTHWNLRGGQAILNMVGPDKAFF